MTIEDLRTLPDRNTIEADLCIVGSGPAGLGIALQLIGMGQRVVVLESGDLECTPEAEALNEIESIGLRRAPQELVRRRGLGGASALWSGRCGVFDAIDHQERPWVANSGWPFDETEVARYTERAGRLLGLGPAVYSDRAHVMLRDSKSAPLWNEELLLPVVWQYSKHVPEDAVAVRDFASAGVDGAEHIGALQHAAAPGARRFGESYRSVLRDAQNVRVFLNATATCVELEPHGQSVRGVTVASPPSAAHPSRGAFVACKHLVLAAGGIENARLMLASRSVNPRGVGNDRDVVGRYLMDHPYAVIASYDGPGSEALRRRLGPRWYDRGGIRHVYQLGIRLSPDVQRRERLVNSVVQQIEHGDGAAPISLVGRVARSLKNGAVTLDVARDALAAVKDPTGLAMGAYDRYVLHRPSMSSPTHVDFGCVPEQVPDWSSRLTLSDATDALGMPRSVINWRANDLEFETIKRTGEIFVSEVARLGYEPPKLAPWMQGGPSAYRELVHDMAHPTGTTRMSSDPGRGVVDEHCQVHGIEGLYVAGSSVFPTAGYMNPTLMLLSLSLRLADDLKRKLARTSVASSDATASARVTRVGIIGAGARVRTMYLPILRALRDELEVVGVVGSSPAKREAAAAATSVAAFDDAATLVRETKPDFLIVAVSSDANDSVFPSLVELGVPLLLETPFCWNVRKGRKLAKRIQELGLIVGVAEQFPFFPAEQLKRHVIARGLIGRVVAAHNDFAVYDYHGIATLRAVLSQSLLPTRVNAQYIKLGSGEHAAINHETWMQGTAVFPDGSVLAHSYSPGYADSPIRMPRSLRTYGTQGSIVDDTLRAHDQSASVFDAKLERDEQQGRLLGMSVRTPLGTVRWTNPFADHAFSDEQIAVATLIRGMKSAVDFDSVPAYLPEEGLADMEILAAMGLSAQRDGSPIGMPLQPEIEKARNLGVRMAREGARKLVNKARL